MKPPAFQFYPDDFIGGTVALTTVDVGAYMRLLCYQWGNGKIPIEKSAVDRVAGCPVSDEVMAKFPNRRNKRLESERKKQADYREKQRQNGLASGRARRSTTVQPPFNHRSTKPEPSVVAVSLEPNGNSPSPSPSPSSSPKEYNTEIEKRLLVLFLRKQGDQMSYSEQAAISAISRRPNAMNEVSEIEAFHRREKKFFPRSLFALVGEWQKYLDHARLANPSNGAVVLSPNIFTMQNQTALTRVEDRLKYLRGQMPLTDEKLKSEFATLKIERVRLMEILGFKA